MFLTGSSMMTMLALFPVMGPFEPADFMPPMPFVTPHSEADDTFGFTLTPAREGPYSITTSRVFAPQEAAYPAS